MGLPTKQVSGDHELDWSHTLLQSPTLEIPKPAPTRRQPPQSEQLKCPRCESTNTKFCYYNNYNKLQPRHFCKSCKRHWTKGGTLRNVPVGGGRKNKRLKRSNSATTTVAAATTKTNSQMGIHSLIRPPSLLQNDLMPPTPPPPAATATAAEHQNHRLQFSFSNLSYFDTNPSPIFTSPPLLNAYNHAQKLEDEETIAAICDPPWQIPSGSSNVIEMPNYWNWNYLDTMVTADLNIPWDDTEIKP